jgi:uncharacterized membrane protein YfcA
MSIWIAVVMCLAFTFFGLLWKKTWIFYIAGVAWIVMAIFNFQDYTTADMGWYFGWIYCAIALVCLSAGVWLREPKDKVEEEDERDKRYRERQEKINKSKGI